MEAKFTNGSTVNRIWDDGTELMAVFQYEGDAIAFANAKVADDAKSNMSPCDYAVHCTYSGKMTMVRSKAAAIEKRLNDLGWIKDPAITQD